MLSTNANVVLSHPTIRGMDADLSAMWLRLTELLLCRPFEAGHFVEVAAMAGGEIVQTGYFVAIF